MLQISAIVKKTEELFELIQPALLRRGVYPPGHHRIPGRGARSLWLVQRAGGVENRAGNVPRDQHMRGVSRPAHDGGLRDHAPRNGPPPQPAP